MLLIATSLTVITISVIAYSLCRIPSRACRHILEKSLVFENQDDAKCFGDLLASGDAESIHRILKVLRQRGDIDVFESEHEIYVSRRQSVSADERRKITRGLLVSDYDPVEDFRNLTVTTWPHPDARAINAVRNTYAGGNGKGFTAEHEGNKDHLFSLDYDVIELLENLTIHSAAIYDPIASA